MANYLSTLGSDINVLMLCATDMEINGEQYVAEQPFTYLKGVTASIDSQTVIAQTATTSPSYKGLHLLDGQQYLDQIVLNNVPFSKKVQGLFFNKQGNSTYNNFDWTPVVNAQQKLKGEPIQIFVYKNGTLMSEGYEIDGQWLKMSDYDTTNSYLVGYSYRDEQLFAFTSKNYPYFKLVLSIKGNVANKTSDQTIIFEKVALIPQTALNFLPNTQNFVSLNFGIIDAEKTVRMKI